MNSSNDQPWLPLQHVLVRHACLTKELYEELKPKLDKLDKSHKRKQVIYQLDRVAYKQKSFEIETNEGFWIASSIGKTSTNYYLWDLRFQPK